MKEETERTGEQAGKAVPPTVSRTTRVEPDASGSEVQNGLKPRDGRRWWNIPSWFAFGSMRRKPPAAPTAERQPEPGMVQQELALQNLKPCRNDLSDADWELAQKPVSGARLGFLKSLAGSAASERRGGASRGVTPSTPAARR